jgi:hypothetical protein
VFRRDRNSRRPDATEALAELVTKLTLGVVLRPE